MKLTIEVDVPNANNETLYDIGTTIQNCFANIQDSRKPLMTGSHGDLKVNGQSRGTFRVQT